MSAKFSTNAMLNAYPFLFGLQGGEDNLSLRLFKNNFSPDPDSIIGDFVEADFPGYAPQGAGMSGPIEDSPGHIEADAGGVIDFTADVIVVPQTIFGWYITANDIGGSPLRMLAYDVAAIPIVVSVLGQIVSVTIEFTGLTPGGPV